MRRIVVAAIALALLWLGAGCGGDGAGAGDHATGPARPDSLPAAPGDLVELPISPLPGTIAPRAIQVGTTYLVDVLHTAFTIRPPWPSVSAGGDLQGGATVVIGDAAQPGGTIAVDDVAGLRAFDDPYWIITGGEVIAHSRAMPDDPVAWLAGRPFLVDPTVQDVTVGGLPGRMVEFSTDIPATAPACGADRCALLFANPATGHSIRVSSQEPTRRRRLYVLHAPAGDLLLATNGANLAQEAADSIRFYQRPSRVAGAITTTTVAGTPAGAQIPGSNGQLEAGFTYIVDRGASSSPSPSYRPTRHSRSTPGARS